MIRPLAGVFLIVASLTLCACSSANDGASDVGNTSPTQGTSASSSIASDKVVTTAEDNIEEQVGWRPEVDCGAGDFSFEVGKSRTCTITDADTEMKWEADITLTEVEGSTFKVGISISRKALNGDALWSDAGTVTGADLGAAATSILARDDDGEFQVVCDDAEYHYSVGTKITCRYIDPLGEKSAEIEVTAVKGSQFLVSVHVS